MQMFKRKKNQVGAARRRLERPAAESTNSTFRRGQTLNSYRADPIDEDSVRRHTHELNKLRRRIVAALTTVVAFSGLVLFVLWQFTGSVAVEASIEGKSVDFGDRQQVYIDAINKYYGQNPVERLRFAQDTGRLLTFLQRTAPEVQEISSISASGLPSKLTFNLKMRRPVAKWSQGDKAFYVDGDGNSFGYNYYEQPILSIYDENNLGAQPGQATLASSRFLQMVGRLVSELSVRQITIEKLIVPSGKVHEIDALVQGSSIRFKLSVDRSPATQAEDVARVLKYFNERGETPSYVDLRVEQKAYYK